MSKEGIQIAADVFSAMQVARERLMRLACGPGGSTTPRTPAGKQRHAVEPFDGSHEGRG